MSGTFDISPEERATQSQFFYRQLFVTVPPVTHRDADLSGKTAIVTGANAGLGLEASRQLLDLGCKVILAVRNVSNGDIARKDLARGRNLPPGAIQVWELDLSSYESITSFADRAKGLEHLDIAILNAGLYKVFESFSSTGYEEGIQVNYLSNVLLTILLLPIIKEKRSSKSPGQIVLVSSDNAAWSKFDEKGSDPLLPVYKQKMANWNVAERYGVTKLLGQMFVIELAKRVPSSMVTISCANCGMCRGSDLGRQTSGLFRYSYLLISYILGRTCSDGARRIVHAATTVGEAAHGQYIEDARVQPMAPIVYKPEGLRIAKQVYDETLDELSFAGVKEIVNELSKSR
ncbi:NAD(P)-binding protein [Hypoxylon sp. NC1633]|nr:NAD(P)-binding protein [Hypoxylon sp. NC1633]